MSIQKLEADWEVNGTEGDIKLTITDCSGKRKNYIVSGTNVNMNEVLQAFLKASEDPTTIDKTIKSIQKTAGDHVGKNPVQKRNYTEYKCFYTSEGVEFHRIIDQTKAAVAGKKDKVVDKLVATIHKTTGVAIPPKAHGAANNSDVLSILPANPSRAPRHLARPSGAPPASTPLVVRTPAAHAGKRNKTLEVTITRLPVKNATEELRIKEQEAQAERALKRQKEELMRIAAEPLGPSAVAFKMSATETISSAGGATPSADSPLPPLPPRPKRVVPSGATAHKVEVNANCSNLGTSENIVESTQQLFTPQLDEQLPSGELVHSLKPKMKVTRRRKTI